MWPATMNVPLWLMGLVVLLSRCEAIAKFDGSQRLVFKTPELTEEEEHSLFLPGQFQCDGCKAVAFQMFKKFDEFNRKYRHYKYDLPEWEVLEVMEQACDFHTFEHSNYGLKDVDGVNRLTGPGLEADDMAGVVSGGGKWPKRLMEVCGTFVEQLGEDAIYDSYKHHPQNKDSLETFLCHGEGVTGACRPEAAKVPPSKDL